MAITITVRGRLPARSNRAQSAASAVTRAVPLTRITLFDPGTMNISEMRPSRTMLRRVSMRLLPIQSGRASVVSSSSSTTGPSSPRGEPSVPSGPTVETMQSREAMIHCR